LPGLGKLLEAKLVEREQKTEVVVAGHSLGAFVPKIEEVVAAEHSWVEREPKSKQAVQMQEPKIWEVVAAEHSWVEREPKSKQAVQMQEPKIW
jgi:hypothetical protein